MANRTKKSCTSSSITDHTMKKLKTKGSPRPCGEEQTASESNSTNQTRTGRKDPKRNELCTHAESRPGTTDRKLLNRADPAPQRRPREDTRVNSADRARTTREGIGQPTHLDDDERRELPLPPGTIQVERRPSR